MKKPFVTNWLKAIEYFMWAYCISQIIAVIVRFWSSSDLGHFITMMILLPSFVFFYSGRYLSSVPYISKENRRLGLLWVAITMVLDFGIYIVIANFPIVRIYVYGLPFLAVTYLLTLIMPFLYKHQRQPATQDQKPILDKTQEEQ